MNQPQPSPTVTSFSALQLAEPLLRALATNGFTQPTEIQARAIPAGLEGRDVLASAQTGTGKTAAFVLPALHRLMQPARAPGRGPRVLILTPTRELAGQVEAVIRKMGQFTRMRFGCIVGGVSYDPQERLLRNPLDILVATPGRLIDHMNSKLVDYSRLELFVLDEADRMLDMGFIKPVQQIAAALPAERQTLLFSATVEGGVQDIARRLLRNPVEIRLATAKQRHESIDQRLQTADSPEHKHALLVRILENPDLTQAIVFTATKRGADKLAKRLTERGHNAAALHGNMRQSARKRTLDSLRSGQVKILVATDVAARGIDLQGVSHVVNFELPTVAEDYIHRVGRTGRNGASGVAISLVGQQDRVKLNNIERLLGRRLEREQVAGIVLPPAPVRSQEPRSTPPAHGNGNRSAQAPQGRDSRQPQVGAGRGGRPQPSGSGRGNRPPQSEFSRGNRKPLSDAPRGNRQPQSEYSRGDRQPLQDAPRGNRRPQPEFVNGNRRDPSDSSRGSWSQQPAQTRGRLVSPAPTPHGRTASGQPTRQAPSEPHQRGRRIDGGFSSHGQKPVSTRRPGNGFSSRPSSGNKRG